MDGIIFVVFGAQFELMAIKTIAYSRRFTNLPFHILTDLKEILPGWKDIPNITFQVFDPIHNRQIKTTMIDHSPFDRTLYIDCDAIIAKPDVEGIIKLLDDHDILLVQYGTYTQNMPMMNDYKITFRKNVIKYPINIYYGAFIGFNKTEKSKLFFNEWNKAWITAGTPREMPALACAAQNTTDLKIKIIQCKHSQHSPNETESLFAWHTNTNAIIQHEYSSGWWKKYHPEVGFNR